MTDIPKGWLWWCAQGCGMMGLSILLFKSARVLRREAHYVDRKLREAKPV